MVFWGSFWVKKGVILDPLFGPPFDGISIFDRAQQGVWPRRAQKGVQKGVQKGGHFGVVLGWFWGGFGVFIEEIGLFQAKTGLKPMYLAHIPGYRPNTRYSAHIPGYGPNDPVLRGI